MVNALILYCIDGWLGQSAFNFPLVYRIILVVVRSIIANIHVLLLQYVVCLLVCEAQFIRVRILCANNISVCDPLVVLGCRAATSLMWVIQQVLAALLIATLWSLLALDAGHYLGSMGLRQVWFHWSTSSNIVIFKLWVLHLNWRLAYLILC